MNVAIKPEVKTMESQASLHCPICTHTVQGTILTHGRVTKVKPGQKCSRCSSPLDPAFIIRYDRAA